MNKKGYLHIYTGNGKGKTTAALGLALRAVCAGKRVFLAQFVKGMDYSELKAINYLDNFMIKQYGDKCFINNKPKKEDILLAQNGFNEVKNNLEYFDVIVLDEITIAIYYNLIKEEEIIDLIKNKPEKLELILTGRYATDKLINAADLVTEMKEIKHYYTKGVIARIGIEK